MSCSSYFLTVPYSSGLTAKDYYRQKVTELFVLYDEITIALLNEKVPGAYDYLNHFDAEWLKSRIVFANNLKSVRKYENGLLESVRTIITRLKTDGYPKRQVTYGYIAELIGSKRDALRGRSAIRTLLNEIIESKPNWLRRRTVEICKERAMLSKLTTVITIKRELCLREATFTQYGTMLLCYRR
jgi:hypothetical protein